jgi:hypothetical protein
MTRRSLLLSFRIQRFETTIIVGAVVIGHLAAGRRRAAAAAVEAEAAA